MALPILRQEFFGADCRGLIDFLLEFLRRGLHVRFDEDDARVGGQFNDPQAAGGDSTSTIERIAQEGIIYSRLADRHFARIDSGFIGQECAIIDVLNKFFLSPHDDVPVRIQLEEMDDLDAQSFYFSSKGNLGFFSKVGDLVLETQLENIRGMKLDLLSQVPHFFFQGELRGNSIEIMGVDYE